MKSKSLTFIRLVVYIIVSTLVCSTAGCSSNTDSDDDQDIIKNTNAFEQNEKIARSVNLGNALEAPSEGEWGVTLEAEYFRLIAEVGFNGVRIPVRWSAHAQTFAPYKIDTGFRNRVDWAIQQASSNGLACVVNIHHYEEIFSEPENHKNRFLAIISQIAEHYKDQSDDFIFEILNEPHDQLTAELWNDYLLEAIQIYRAIDPDRTLMIGTAEWGGVHSLSKLSFPDTLENIIVTVHYYNPFHFTHQGAEWVDGSDEWLGTTWRGLNSEMKDLRADLDLVEEWASEHNRPIYIGEFGAYSKADMISREAWTSALSKEAEARGMSWGYWEFCAGFGLYNRDSNSWNYQLLNALIPED